MIYIYNDNKYDHKYLLSLFKKYGGNRMAKIELRVSESFKDAVKEVCANEFDGNVSAYIKKLLLDDLQQKMKNEDYIEMIKSTF